jgi:hypothetical protein
LPGALSLALAALGLAAVCGLGQQVETLISAGLLEPYGAAVDLCNYYYITDSANNRLVRYTPKTGVVTNFAGSPSREAGATDGKGIFARFYSPQGIVVVPARKGLIVADSGNHLLRQVSYAGEVTTVAGSTGGFQDGTGTVARFQAPAGLAADSEGNVYIADLQNHAIRKLALNNVVTTLAANFVRPGAVAIGDDGRLYVADMGHHSIKAIPDLSRTNQTAVLVAGSGSSGMFGYKDSMYATNALFDNPNSLLWVGGNIGLLVGDSGNHVLRRVFTNTVSQTYSVETYAPSVGIGLNNPVGLAGDLAGSLLVVDLGNNNLRRISAVQPAQPPVGNPVIGYVELTNSFMGTRLFAVGSATFTNDVVVGILAEPDTYTFYTFGSTGAAEGVPDPTSASALAPAYAENSPTLPTNLLDLVSADVKSNVTIKAISTHPQRQPSDVVSASFRFQVADPAIYGFNPAAFTMGSATTNADLWYTTDGQDPAPGGSAAKLYQKDQLLDILRGTNDVVFKVRGFRPAYYPSAIVQRTVVGQAFVVTNIEVSALGFVRDFTGAPGATLVLPIELRLAGNGVLGSLQFRVEVQTNGTAPMLAAPLRLVAASPQDFIPLTTTLGEPTDLIHYTTGTGTGLGLAYLPAQQNFRIDESGPIVLLWVTIPPAAKEGQSYTLAVLEPSGTSESSQDAVLLTPTANRTLWISKAPYLVGDSAPAEWYNAGDFGDQLLSNNDVNNAFYASLGVRVPFAFTDAFDAMDAFPLDTADRVGGDGQLRFLDWQITLERSLKLRPGGWRRTRGPGGERLPVAPPAAGKTSLKGPATTTLAGSAGPLWRRQVKVAAGTVENAQAADTVRVPICVSLVEGANLAGLQIWPVISTRVDAVDSEQPSQFEPNTLALMPAPSPSLCPGYSTNNVAYVWDRGRFDPPLVGTNLLGWLSFRVPGLAPDGQEFVVRFANADGAPVEDVQYDFETVPGSVWVNSLASRPPERISDEWKSYFFGSLTAASAQAGADPDNDGLSNLAEYLLNTNPTLPDWRIWVRLEGSNVVVGWYGEQAKRYEVLDSTDLNTWRSLSPVLPGNDQMQEFTDSNPAPAARFYRVRMLP